MNFKLNNIILVNFALAFASSNLPDGVDASLLQPQQQLRGSQSNFDNYGQRKMVEAAGSGGSFCPQKAPADSSSCENVLPDGMSYGNCFWQSSSWDSHGKTTTGKDSCACTRKVGTWDCSTENETKTSPPTPSPPRQRKMVTGARSGSSFCPKQVPVRDSSCANVLPDGMSSGNCSWHRSAWDSHGTTTTEKDYCTCKRKMGTWDCSGESETKTSPPAPSPPHQRKMVAAAVSGSSFCPKKAPVDGSLCANVLPDGMSSGNCFWQISSSDCDGTTTTENDSCACTAKVGTWNCSKEIETKTSPPAPSPPPSVTASDNDWCPKTVPTTDDTCLLPTGKTTGSCTYNSIMANGDTTENVCGCKSDSSTFVCKESSYKERESGR